MSKDYGSWSLADLKIELRKRNAKVTGKKAVLVQRLTEYDNLFGSLINDPESTYKITVPVPQDFRDITSDTSVPVLSDEDLARFSALVGREDVATSSNMYNEGFLMTSRIAQLAGEFYVIGVCSSEMRKSVSYNVTIKFKEHVILETQCECAAGMGPYAQCKHVLVLIYGLIDFTKNKKIKTQSSCTANLQTFHHPGKSYTGNPVTVDKLVLRKRDQHLKEIIAHDPRPNPPNKENTWKTSKAWLLIIAL